MFGYVKVFEDELRVREWKTYRSYYCGLCKQIAGYSQVARLMLSYDMVFLAILLDAVVPEETKQCKRKLLRHCRKACGDERLKYAAALSVIFQYRKLENDVFDGDRHKKLFMNAIAAGYRKAAADYPKIDAQITQAMKSLYQLEEAGSTDLTALDPCFATAFLKAFEEAPVQEENLSVKGQIAYHVAAWVYWFDMLLDVEKDRKTGDFNVVLLAKEPERVKEQIKQLLLRHIEEAESLFSLLPYSEEYAIIDNIISIGIPRQMQMKGLPDEECETDELS